MHAVIQALQGALVRVSQRFNPMMRLSSCVVLVASAALAGCGGSRMDINEMTAATPTDLGSAADAGQSSEYLIGPGDKLNVRVFQVADLSIEELIVDASGHIQLPLIGSVQGAGLTADALARDVERRLGARYLRNPQVSINVIEAASQKITIDGAVTKPGVYEMRGVTSLLQAVAMAEGPSRTADLSKVAVFRTIDGQRAVAVFDLGMIRQGRASDPRVLGDDVIVVDSSQVNSLIREVLGAAPLLSVFRAY